MKKKMIIAFVALSVLGLGLFYFLITGNIGEKYNTVKVKKSKVEKYVEEVGRISSRNIRRYYGNGTKKVEKIDLELGEHVKKGQLLVKYEENLDLQIQKVEKQIEALEATYSEVLSGTDMESVNNAKIKIASIQSKLDLAIKNMERTEKLYNNKAVSQVKLEAAVNNVEQLNSSLEIARNTYNKLSKGVSEDIKHKYEAEVEVLLLTLESIERNKEKYMIFTDTEGVVTAVNTFKGDIPAPGRMFLELQDPSEKVLTVDFMMEDARKIKENMKAKIEDQKLGVNVGNLVVKKIYPKAFVTLSELGVEENRQTIEIGLANSGEELAFGVEVKIKVMIEDSREVLIIPKSAIYQENSKKYVKVLENGSPVEREIETGTELKNDIEIKEGLSEGDLVILIYEED